VYIIYSYVLAAVHLQRVGGKKMGVSEFIYLFFYEYTRTSDIVKCVWHGRIYGNVMDLNKICKCAAATRDCI